MMRKIPLATQIPKALKVAMDQACERKGCSLSYLITEAIQDKLDDLHEEEALLAMAMERLSEPGERSYQDFKRTMRLTRSRA